MADPKDCWLGGLQELLHFLVANMAWGSCAKAIKKTHRQLHSEITKLYPSFTLNPKVEPSTSNQQKNSSCENHSFDFSPLFLHSPLTRFDHLVAIERAGMAADGNYYNARKVNIKHLVDPIDELFLAAQTIPGVTTTGRCQFV